MKTTKYVLAMAAGLILASALVMPPSAFADTLVINRTVTGITPQFNGTLHLNAEILSFDTSGISNISLANYASIQWNLFAPAGQEIVLNQDATGAFNVFYSNGNSAVNSNPAEFCGFVYQGQGPMPTGGSGSCTVSSQGNFFSIEMDFNFFAGDAFTELSFNLPLPATVANQPASDFALTSDSSAGFLQISSSFQPGYVTFQPAPEPGSLALVVAGLLGMLGAVRRKLIS